MTPQTQALEALIDSHAQWAGLGLTAVVFCVFLLTPEG